MSLSLASLATDATVGLGVSSMVDRFATLCESVNFRRNCVDFILLISPRWIVSFVDWPSVNDFARESCVKNPGGDLPAGVFWVGTSIPLGLNKGPVIVSKTILHSPLTSNKPYSLLSATRRRNPNCCRRDTCSKPCFKPVPDEPQPLHSNVASLGSQNAVVYWSRKGRQHFEQAKQPSCQRIWARRKHWSSHVSWQNWQVSQSRLDNESSSNEYVCLLASSTSCSKNRLIGEDWPSWEESWRIVGKQNA